jgi:hypothetical protein
LHCFILTIRSLVKNKAVQQLNTDMIAFDVDIAAVIETWLKKIYIDSFIAINGYFMFRLDRTERKGGGLCVYVCEGMQAKELRTINYLSCRAMKHELLWLSIVKDNQSYVLGIRIIHLVHIQN